MTTKIKSGVISDNAITSAHISSGAISSSHLTGIDTDAVSEGSSNLYFTTTRARTSLSVTDSGGDGSLTYDNSTGAITYTGPSAAEVRAHISVTDSGGDGSLAYSNGVITYTGPSASEVRAHLSAGTGVTYSSGEFSIGQSVATTASPTFADINITGDLNLTGDINSYNITDLDIVDQTITLGVGQSESASDGSGIVIAGSNASILWDEPNDEFDFNKSINVTGTITSSGNITGTLATAAQPNITSVGTLTGLTITGNLVIGTEDNNAAILEISGGATGSAEGGEIRLDTAADYDGTYEFYRIDVNQDDFRIGRQGQTDLTINSSGNAIFGGTISSGAITSTGAITLNGTLGTWSVDNQGAIMNFSRATANYIRAGSTNGYLVFQTNGANAALTLNAQQNATFAGNITSGANGGIIKEIGSDISLVQGGVGLRINDAASALSPTTNTVNNDAAVDLGVSNIRFRNLYLSGTANISDNILNSGAAGSATVFNEDGTTADFRIESDTKTHMFFLDGSLNRIGINTASPSHTLHILNEVSSDTIDENNGLVKMQSSGGNGMIFGTIASSPFTSYIQSAYVADTSLAQYNLALNPIGGNVGIGTTNPGQKLEVAGNIDIGSNGVKASMIGRSATNSADANINFWDYDHATFPGHVHIVADSAGSDGTYGAGQIVFWTHNGSAFNVSSLIDKNGKFIIGDTASHTDDLLQIETPASGGGHGIQIRRNDSNNDQGIGHIQFGNNTDTDLAKISAKTDGSTDNAALLFHTQNDGGSLTERMRINHDGEVGIATNDPESTLHVAGTTRSNTYDIGSTESQFGFDRYKIRELNNLLYAADKRFGGVSGSSNLQTEMFNGNQDSGYTIAAGTTYVVTIDLNQTITYPAGDAYISFYHIYNDFQSVSGRMYYTAGPNAGTWVNMGAAETIRGGANQGNRLVKLSGAGSVYLGKFEFTFVTKSTAAIVVTDIAFFGNRVAGRDFRPYLRTDVGQNLTENITFVNNSTATVGSIVVSSSGTAFNQTSDYRLKENVSEVINATDKINQLNPITFNWISDDTNTPITGFLAHEVSEVIPEAVTGEKDAVVPPELFTETDPLPDGVSVGDVKDPRGQIKPQQLDHSKLVPLLTKAIQELSTKLEAAEARITELEG